MKKSVSTLLAVFLVVSVVFVGSNASDRKAVSIASVPAAATPNLELSSASDDSKVADKKLRARVYGGCSAKNASFIIVVSGFKSHAKVEVVANSLTNDQDPAVWMTGKADASGVIRAVLDCYDSHTGKFVPEKYDFTIKPDGSRSSSSVAVEINVHARQRSDSRFGPIKASVSGNCSKNEYNEVAGAMKVHFSGLKPNSPAFTGMQDSELGLFSVNDNKVVVDRDGRATVRWDCEHADEAMSIVDGARHTAVVFASPIISLYH